MPLIHKRRIWWEPVDGAKEYVIYVSLDNTPIDPEHFSWVETPRMISKLVVNKNELVIPDEWPEFPSQAGTYHIAVTARNEVGNQSDPLILSGVFNFVAPKPPIKGGVESLSTSRSESKNEEDNQQSSDSDKATIIQKGLNEVRQNDTLGNAYLGRKAQPIGIPIRNSEAEGS